MTDARLTAKQGALLQDLRSQCDRKGWFFVNATNLEQLNDVLHLEINRFVAIDERDVRFDPVSERVRAGEFVGKVL